MKIENLPGPISEMTIFPIENMVNRPRSLHVNQCYQRDGTQRGCGWVYGGWVQI